MCHAALQLRAAPLRAAPFTAAAKAVSHKRSSRSSIAVKVREEERWTRNAWRWAAVEASHMHAVCPLWPAWAEAP